MKKFSLVDNRVTFISARELDVIFISLLINVFARAPILFNIIPHSTDDYRYYVWNSTFTENPNLDILGACLPCIAQGRFGIHLIFALCDFLNIDFQSGHFLGPLLLSFQLIILSFLIIKFLEIKVTKLEAVLIICLISLHPYGSNLFEFKGATLQWSLTLGFLLVGFCLNLFLSQKRFKQILAVVLLIYSISCYQVLLNFAILTAIFKLFQENIFKRDIVSLRKIYQSEELKTLFLILCSAIFYYLLFKLMCFYFEITPNKRSGFLGLDGLGNRLSEIKLIFFSLLLESQPILTIKTKIIILTIIALGIFSSIKNLDSIVFRLIMHFLFFMISILIVIGPLLITKFWWPTPRSLYAISLIAPFYFLLIINQNDNQLIKKLSKSLVLLLVIAFVFTNNKVHVNQYTVSLRDQLEMNRIISRIESIPDFHKKSIAFIGIHPDPRIGVSTKMMSFNRPSLHSGNSRIALFQYLSGYDNTFIKNTKQIEKLKKTQEFKNTPNWPDINSVVLIENTIVVKFR